MIPFAGQTRASPTPRVGSGGLGPTSTAPMVPGRRRREGSLSRAGARATVGRAASWSFRTGGYGWGAVRTRGLGGVAPGRGRAAGERTWSRRPRVRKSGGGGGGAGVGGAAETGGSRVGRGQERSGAPRRQGWEWRGASGAAGEVEECGLGRRSEEGSSWAGRGGGRRGSRALPERPALWVRGDNGGGGGSNLRAVGGRSGEGLYRGPRGRAEGLGPHAPGRRWSARVRVWARGAGHARRMAGPSPDVGLGGHLQSWSGRTPPTP